MGAHMTVAVVLASDWDNKVDPITYYATDPTACLNFLSQPAKPRTKLTEQSRKNMSDCEHGVVYPVVICTVHP